MVEIRTAPTRGAHGSAWSALRRDLRHASHTCRSHPVASMGAVVMTVPFLSV